MTLKAGSYRKCSQCNKWSKLPDSCDCGTYEVYEVEQPKGKHPTFHDMFCNQHLMDNLSKQEKGYKDED